MIREYLARLAGELDFDPALSRAVEREVEDHLLAALQNDPAADRQEAERRAVAQFGEARALAAQFAAVSLAAQARHVSLVAVLLITAVFVAMRARIAWYGLAPFPLADEARALAEMMLVVDRGAFWLAALTALAGWLYIDTRRARGGFTRAYFAQLRRFSLLCSGAAAALAVCVAADGALTSLRLIGAQWSPAALIPVLSMAIEIACAGVLVSYLRAMARRAAATSRFVPAT